MNTSSSNLKGLHVFLSGASGTVGTQLIREFLDQDCYVTAHDLETVELSLEERNTNRFRVVANGPSEENIADGFREAWEKYGPIHVLVLYAGTADESHSYPIWDLPLDVWEKRNQDNSRRTFLTIKHFLRRAKDVQIAEGREIENLAIVIISSHESEDLGHSNDHAFAKYALQYGLVQRTSHDITQLNSSARINAVVFNRVDGPRAQAGGNLGNGQAQETQLVGMVRATSFLASHRTASHLSGECLRIDNDTEGRLIWNDNDIINFSGTSSETSHPQPLTIQTIPQSTSRSTGNKIRVALTIDLDAVSGWLGTGYSPENVLADYSAGFFAARVGVPRLLGMLKRRGIADKVTWFIPGHSAESFTSEVQQVVDTGCEIGLHGYAHEGAYSLTVQQERDILEKCIKITEKLTGKKPRGYRAPLYQIRESTLDLLEEYGFEYDSSLTDHDCQPFFAPRRPSLKPIDYSKPASSWMHPIPTETGGSPDRRPLVEIPGNYYMEDMTPMQFWPHTPNTQGYVNVRLVEQMWIDRFLWIREYETNPIFTLILHPDTSGMAHIIGMIDRMIQWLQGWGDEVEFMQAGDMARWWLKENAQKGTQ